MAKIAALEQAREVAPPVQPKPTSKGGKRVTRQDTKRAFHSQVLNRLSLLEGVGTMDQTQLDSEAAGTVNENNQQQQEVAGTTAAASSGATMDGKMHNTPAGGTGWPWGQQLPLGSQHNIRKWHIKQLHSIIKVGLTLAVHQQQVGSRDHGRRYRCSTLLTPGSFGASLATPHTLGQHMQIHILQLSHQEKWLFH